MDLITVYRVEKMGHPKIGLYRSWVASSYLHDRHRHPGPEEDPKLNIEFITSNFFFGFNSVAQLKEWIFERDWRVKLHEAKYHCAVFEAKGVVGRSQVIFDWDTRPLGEEKFIPLVGI